MAAALGALSGTCVVAQTPVCNGKNVYPCSVGGTLLVLNKPTNLVINGGSGITAGGGGSGAFIADPLNPGFSLTAATAFQAPGPVLPSLSATFNVATVSGQPGIAGAIASITCGVTGSAAFGLVLSTPGGPLILNCPHFSAPGMTALVSGQTSFPPLTSLAMSLTLSGTAPTGNDLLTLGAISAQAQIPSPGCIYSISPGGQAFSPAGGNGTIAITTGAGCAWSVSNVPSWVTITSAASGTGNGMVTYQVAPDVTSDRTATMVVANLAFNLEQEAAPNPGLSFIGSMPHVAANAGWNTTFTFVNKTTDPVLTRSSLFADDGTPLTLPLSFPLQPPTGQLLGATVDRTLPGNASAILQTSGTADAPVVTGSAQLSATGAPGTSVDGFAIFHFDPTSQEAVVPIETRNAPAYVLAFDQTNSVSLGFAIENLASQSATVHVILRDDTGTQIGTGSIQLNGNGHFSDVLYKQFSMTANIRGTAEFDTPPGGQISVLGIRFTPPGTLTTVPALTNPGTGGLVSHIASGGGWETTFVLVNLSSTPQQPLLTFSDDGGNPLSLPLASPDSGSIPAMSPFVSPVIAPGASVWIQSAASASLTGSARLSGNVTGFVIFRFDPSGQEAIAPLESRNAGAYLLAFDNTSGTATGVAIGTVSPLPVTIPVLFRNAAGTLVGATMISLPPNGHTSFDLGKQYSITANIRGTVEFQKPTGAQIGVLGIRAPSALTFTSLPPLAK